MSSHDEQRRKSRMESLRRSGIGSRFIDRSLRETPAGEVLAEWLVDNREAVRGGTGLTLVGGGADGYDTFALVARGVLLGYRVPVMFTTLIRLAHYLGRGDGEWDLGTGALFITRFCEVGDSPLRPFERAAVEDLLDRRMDNGNPTFLWAPQGDLSTWWSPVTVDRIKRINETGKA
jgi:hypothetical protein